MVLKEWVQYILYNQSRMCIRGIQIHFLNIMIRNSNVAHLKLSRVALVSVVYSLGTNVNERRNKIKIARGSGS